MSLTGKAALASGVNALKPRVGETAPLDARLLLAHALDVPAARLVLYMDASVDDAQLKTYENLLAERALLKPVSQIIGYREFWGRRFDITTDVLDPRPDTETLVEYALAENPPNTILDLGTGSGCILLTLLAEWPDATGVGVDLSAHALEVAKQNAISLGLSARASFKQSDWFEHISDSFDMIVSNPPYISAKEMAELSPEVREWEPHLALTPGEDGLEAYRIITKHAGKYLRDGGTLVLEIGHKQADSVCELLRLSDWQKIVVQKDIDGRDRVILAKKD